MNIKQVKEKFTLQSLLSSLGHYPDKKKSKGSDLWYISPFRPNEKTPSFHISTKHDIYKDFGDTERGGDIIRFAQMYLKYQGSGGSISEALKWFEQHKGSNYIPYKKSGRQTKEEKTAVYTILTNKEIFSTSLIHYLENKKIPLELAKKYLRQIYFIDNRSNKKLYGLGFKTRSGGVIFERPMVLKLP